MEKPRTGLSKKALFFVLVAVAGEFVLIALLPFLGFYLFVHGMSETADRVELISPDGRYVATGYHVIGSATVNDSTVVMIRPTHSSEKDSSILCVDNLKPFHLSWRDNTKLVVTYSSGATFEHHAAWRDVTVDFVEN